MKNLKKFVCNLDIIISGLKSLCNRSYYPCQMSAEKIMNQPIAWLEEMQLLALFIYAIFFGGSVAFRYRLK